MVYGIAYCPLDKSDSLKKLGCADSKVLSEEKREELFGKLCNDKDYVGWAVEVISPNSICNSMLKRYFLLIFLSDWYVHIPLIDLNSTFIFIFQAKVLPEPGIP